MSASPVPTLVMLGDAGTLCVGDSCDVPQSATPAKSQPVEPTTRAIVVEMLDSGNI